MTRRSRSSLRPAACAAGCFVLAAACSVDNRSVGVSTGESLPGAAGAAALAAMGPAASDTASSAGSTGAAGVASTPVPGSASGAAGTAGGEPPGTGSETGSCGDGQRQASTEACDDGNQLAGDGCSADCASIERGFLCAQPGRACMPFAACGDAIVALTEQCDDGNQRSGDGCSDLCRVEPGMKCEGEPSACARTLCGDSVRQGSEDCDDGNDRDGDGCSASCEREPECAGTVCQPSCGDGLVVGEACDDGNLLDGDGCSTSCQLELGSICRAAPPCEPVAGQCTRRVPVVFRDFADLQPDFGNNVCDARAPGAVSRFLDAARKPTLATGAAVTQACISTPESFAAWFTDAADRPALSGELRLFDDGLGGYINRFGAEGQRFQAPQTVPIFDGTPLFFPVDTLAGATAQPAPASIPVQYGVPQVTAESTLFPGAPNHNFAFTAQLELPFLYDSGSVASLTIAADDDVWVFINGVLALDLGGVHEPITASLLVDGSIGLVTTRVQEGATETATLPAADFGLLRGTVYLVSIFHAERQPPVSSLLLQMSGLGSAPSLCRSACGDALLGFSEECDDGINDGGYGECGPGCKLGPYCGDGITQPEFGETCDAGSSFSAGCRECRVVAGN